MSRDKEVKSAHAFKFPRFFSKNTVYVAVIFSEKKGDTEVSPVCMNLFSANYLVSL